MFPAEGTAGVVAVSAEVGKEDAAAVFNEQLQGPVKTEERVVLAAELTEVAQERDDTALNLRVHGGFLPSKKKGRAVEAKVRWTTVGRVAAFSAWFWLHWEEVCVVQTTRTGQVTRLAQPTGFCQNLRANVPPAVYKSIKGKTPKLTYTRLPAEARGNCAKSVYQISLGDSREKA